MTNTEKLAELAPLPNRLEELLSEYWDAAYDEGTGHKPEVDPNQTLSQIREEVRNYARAALAATPAATVQVGPYTVQARDNGRSGFLTLGDAFDRAAFAAHEAALAATPAAPQDERAAFEAWIESEAGPAAIKRWLGTDAYENLRVQDNRIGWVAALDWQARAALAATPAAPSIDKALNRALAKSVKLIDAMPAAATPAAEPYAHIVELPSEYKGLTKFFTAPSDPRGFPVYRHPPMAATTAAPHPDTKDAERYRWLREHGDTGCTEKDGYGGQTLRMGDCLDAAIDAAMAGKGKESSNG